MSDEKKRYPKPFDFKPERTFPDDGRPRWGGKRRCIAWNSNAGRQCNALAMSGKRVCDKHGGKTPGGALAGAFKTGRYSKHLPTRLLARYNDALLDPNILELNDEIALVDARIHDLLERIDTGESASLLFTMQDTFREFQTANAKHDLEGARNALSSIGNLITKGIADYAVWNEVNGAVEQRRRLVESQRKRDVEAEQYINATQAMLLLGRLEDIIRRYVPADAYAEVSQELRTLTLLKPGGEA